MNLKIIELEFEISELLLLLDAWDIKINDSFMFFYKRCENLINGLPADKRCQYNSSLHQAIRGRC